MALPMDTGTKATGNVVKYTVILTLIIEISCLILRYGFGIEATSDTGDTIGALTFGMRIHHGYFGVLLLLTYPFTSRLNKAQRTCFLVLGLSLVISDAIHHFAVLWLIEGSPNFDFVYPAPY